MAVRDDLAAAAVDEISDDHAESLEAILQADQAARSFVHRRVGE